jgi:hypothetical protein
MSVSTIYVITIILGCLVGGVGGINSNINKLMGLLQTIGVIILAIYATICYSWLHIIGIIIVSILAVMISTIATYKLRH